MENYDSDPIAGIGPDTAKERRPAPHRLSCIGTRRQQIDGTSGNVSTAYRLRGALGESGLEQALSLALWRHGLLRESLDNVDSTTPQHVAEVRVVLGTTDLQRLRPCDRLPALERGMAAMDRRVLDPARLPLLAARLFRLAPQDCVLVVVISRLVADDRSRELLLREVADVYAVLMQGEPPSVAGCPAHPDVASWQREQVASGATQRHLEFWREYLANLPAPRTLRTDGVRLARHAADVRALGGVGDRIEMLARIEGVTPFHVLLAAFALVLARRADSTEIAVATPLSFRPAAFEHTIGPFVNDAIVRIDCTGSPTFRTLVQHVHRRASDALAHSAVPLHTIADLVRDLRGTGEHLLVHGSFSFVSQPSESIEWPNLDVTSLAIPALPATPFDLALSVVSRGAVLECTCHYDEGIYEPRIIHRLLEDWERILACATVDPGSPIDDYDLLWPEERHQQIVVWNETATAWPPPAFAHEQIAEAGAGAPDRVAVTFDGHHLTYARLNGESRRLAAWLLDRGISPEACVGIVLDRSLDLVVAVVAVLRAGAAYVIAESGEFPDRLAALLSAAGATCVVTSAVLRAALAHLRLPILLVDAARADDAGEGIQGGAVRCPDGESLCAILHTAGTMGPARPVGITHLGLTNALNALRREFALVPADAVLAATPLASGAASLEMLLTLTSGARLVLAPTWILDNGGELAGRIAMEHVSLLCARPTTWRLLRERGWQAPAGLRLVNDGEPLPQELARELLAAGGDVWNRYGCAEGTVWSTLEFVEPAEDPVPIGRPIANLAIYLLNDRLRPVPIGMTGEVYIAAVGVGRGYIGRPELTALRYLPEPFSGLPGTRMYATGDLARRRSDGRMEYCGRGERRHGVDRAAPQLRDRPASLFDSRDRDGRADIAERGVPPVTSAAVRRDPSDTDLILAPQQENWWYNEYLTGNVNPNTIHFASRLPGPLQPIAVEQALSALQRRHEALRTAFVASAAGRGMPVIQPPEAGAFSLKILDLASVSPAAQQQMVSAAARLERARPFDLSRGALWRVSLARLGPDDHVLMFTIHHLVCDGWSIEILTREFSALYTSIINGVPVSLPELAFQYVDFARWQRDWLAGSDAAKVIDYWRVQLAPPLEDLFPPSPFDAEGDGTYLSVRGRVPLTITARSAEAARRLARAMKCTLFSTVLAALKIVLYARTQQADVRVGTFASNRTRPGTEHVVGLFTNIVCLRTHVDRSSGFGDLVRAVHRTIGDATVHQALPFEVLARALVTEHGTPRSRLFQVLVLWQAARTGTERIADVETSPYDAQHDAFSLVFVRNSLDLKFELIETSAAIEGSVTFKLTRFTVEEAQWFVRALDSCITLVEQNPRMTIAELCEALAAGTSLAVSMAPELRVG